MKEYLRVLENASNGTSKINRTGINHIGYFGDMMTFDLSDGFPAVTTKKLAFKTVVAEMLGFLRGYDNAKDFRDLGCNVWNANANDNESWLNNNNRVCHDDLGRIYGVQARDWRSADGSVDQLQKVVNDLSNGVDDRREIVTHWNPGELNEMALPPCHMFYQFGLDNGVLNMNMYQRSADVPLGIPFNIAGYAWLLSVIAKITGNKVGTFKHMLGDVHVYENQLELVKEQLKRAPLKLPELLINEDIKTLNDLETWVTPDDFSLKNYEHHEHIKYPFAV